MLMSAVMAEGALKAMPAFGTPAATTFHFYFLCTVFFQMIVLRQLRFSYISVCINFDDLLQYDS